MAGLKSLLGIESVSGKQNGSNDPNSPAELLKQKLSEKEKKELLAKIDAWFNAAKTERQQFERVWYTHMAFYFGRQYVQWQTNVAQNTARLYEPPVPPWRVRLIVNRIRPIIRKELAKLTQEKPQAFVIPASTDDEDRIAAEAANSIYEHVSREIKLNKVLRQAVFWMCLCGSGFVKDWWDPHQKDSSGQKGSIRAEAVSPFHIYVPDVVEIELENEPFFIHAMAKDLSWVKQVYGDEAQSVTMDVHGAVSILEQKFLSSIGVQNNNRQKNMVLVKEIWIKPCKDFPEGRVIAWAGDQILSSAIWMYKTTEYPLTKIDHIPSGKFYADSVISDLLPIQKEYNRSRSQVIESRNRMSKPQLVAPKGSIDTRKMTSEPGLIIEYKSGHQPPTPLPLQNLPSYTSEELNRLKQDFDDLSSQHEVSQGRTPPGVEAATAISYLQESDDDVLSVTVASIEEAAEKLGRHILVHANQFWLVQRAIKVLGADGNYESYVLSQTDIAGNTDLHVQSGSAAPRSRAAKQAFLMEIGKLGWLPPERLLMYLDMGETNRLYEELQLDSRQAQRENYMLEKSLPATINSWDNHAIHIVEHDNFRKKQRFEALPDEIKVLFETHVQMHRQMVSQSQGTLMTPDGQQGTPVPGSEALQGGPLPAIEAGQQ